MLIGLNKRVYKSERERKYECPALRGGSCTFTAMAAGSLAIFLRFNVPVVHFGFTTGAGVGC